MITQSRATRGKVETVAMVAASAVLAAPASAFADPTPGATPSATANAIERIETRRLPNAREIVIHTSQAPTFSVYRLSEPFRVLVDVGDAALPRPIERIAAGDDPVLSYVSATLVSDEHASVVRVEIALDRRRTYDVRAEGRAIVARIEVPGDQAEAGQPPPSLGKLSAAAEGAAVMISASLAGGVPAAESVSIMELEEPSRVVIDIAGAKADPRYQRVEINEAPVLRARLATHEDGVRIVVDLVDGVALPEVNVDAVAGRLRVAVAPAKPAPVEVAAAPSKVEEAKAEETKVEETKVAEVKVEAREAPAPAAPAPSAPPAAEAPAPAPVAAARPAPKAAERPAPFEPASITDVRFEPKDGFVRLTVELSRDAPVVRDRASTRRLPMLRLSGTKLPKALVRTLDTSALAGEVVRSISTYNDGTDAIIAANVGTGSEHRHWRKGNRLMWDFRDQAVASRAPAEPAKDDTRVLSYPEQATSGFESSAVDLSAKARTGAKRYRGRRISLDLKDADIQNVLRLLADVSKLNIVASDDVSGNITLKLRNVPWDQALDIILQSKKLDKTRNGNIIRVAPIAVLEQEEQLRLSRQEAQQKLEPMSVRLIPVNYADAPAIRAQVESLLSPRGKASVDIRTNVLIVEDIAEVLLKAERLVRTLDTQTPQVLIEARIVEASTNFVRDLGIQWGGETIFAPSFGNQTGLQFPSTIAIRGGGDDGQTPTSGVLATGNQFAVNLPAAAGLGSGGALGFIFGSAGNSNLLTLRLTAAEQQGKSKIVSAPKIVTTDNNPAKISSGEKIPITVLTANGPTTRFIDATLDLDVTPHVTSDGSVRMKIKAAKNELSNRQDILGTPGVITREATTEMLIRDGDTAVMGGIYRRTATENKAYVPWIGQVPVLGWLFKKTSRTDAREELLIFISPRIINRSQALVTGR